jgi:hypothetical protein
MPSYEVAFGIEMDEDNGRMAKVRALCARAGSPAGMQAASRNAKPR